MTTTHLVTGVGGQDGILLARLLVAGGDRVVGAVSPDARSDRLVYLEGVHTETLDVCDTVAFRRLLEVVQPDVVHNLAARSSVGTSWKDLEAVHRVNARAVVGMLEVMAELGSRAPRLVHASSSEIFGPADGESRADEETPLRPVSPYGEAKAVAHRAVRDARASGVVATNLVLFGHTSPLHRAHFAIPTLTRQAAEVARGSRDAITLRDATVRRDWGSARDFVRAFARAATRDPGDFVIATGTLHSLSELCEWAFEAAGVEHQELRVADAPDRPHDFDNVVGDARRAQELLGWRPSVALRDEVVRMVRIAGRRLSTGVLEDPGYLADSHVGSPSETT